MIALALSLLFKDGHGGWMGPVGLVEFEVVRVVVVAMCR